LSRAKLFHFREPFEEVQAYVIKLGYTLVLLPDQSGRECFEISGTTIQLCNDWISHNAITGEYATLATRSIFIPWILDTNYRRSYDEQSLKLYNKLVRRFQKHPLYE
jgi:hypothetical protein